MFHIEWLRRFSSWLYWLYDLVSTLFVALGLIILGVLLIAFGILGFRGTPAGFEPYGLPSLLFALVLGIGFVWAGGRFLRWRPVPSPGQAPGANGHSALEHYDSMIRDPRTHETGNQALCVACSNPADNSGAVRGPELLAPEEHGEEHRARRELDAL